MLAIEDLDGLLALVQSSVVEIHPWGSTTSQLEKPDRLILDLDPGEGVPWSSMIETAFLVRERLEAAGLKAFVKTSGGKGLHVVTSIVPRMSWEQAKSFTQSIAETLAKEFPDRYVATVAKRARTARIFIDYLRNGRGATAVGAYSTRALPSATVSTPITWGELEKGVRSDHFKLGNLRQRVDFLKEDPWRELA